MIACPSPRLQLVPRANCLNWELPVSYGLPGRIIWREPVNRPISSEPGGSEGAVTEQIEALLGDADAPDRWHYRSLQLLTSGDAITALQLAHHPVCADPRAASKSGQRLLLIALATSRIRSCLLYTSPSPRDLSTSRMPSSA